MERRRKGNKLMGFNMVIFILGVIAFTIALLGFGLSALGRVYINLLGEALFIIFFIISGFMNFGRRRYFEGAILIIGAIIVGFLGALTLMNIM